MHRDLQNKRIFLGTKGGEVHIYDISQVILNNNCRLKNPN